MTTTRPDAFPLREIVTMLLAGRAGQRWRVQEDTFWCQVTPAGYPARVQGWKLHVSATWLSAPMVLHQAARVLVGRECAFKFAATLGRVWEVSHKQADRAQAGKFLTAYPRDDDHLRELAALLDEATAGLPGPEILSDRPLREGSLVHLRYGAFAGAPVLTNDAIHEVRLEAPDGTLVEDVREPWFCPPSWARLPFDDPPARPDARPVAPRPAPHSGRFRVTKAIRHSARGGVYRATDQQTGAQVVIKQARAHVGGLSRVGDARDGLRYESAMLAELAGLAPRQVLLFERGSHLFLVLEALDGEPLASWARRWWDDPPGPDQDFEGPPVAEALGMARRLADLVDAVHARGIVFRDFTPGNIMVLAGPELKLVDAELVARPGEWVVQAHTPGFGAPEVAAGPGSESGVGPAPGPESDLFSLGMLLCQLVIGTTPVLAPDSPDGSTGTRSLDGRIATLLEYAAARNPAARALAPAIRGLATEDPARRWDTGRLRAHLDAAAATGTVAPGPAPRGPARHGRLGPDEQRRLAADGLAHLVSAVEVVASERPVTSSEWGNRSDACNVQHGAAGVLAVLVRGSELSGGEQLRAAVGRVAGWLDRHRATAVPLLPGLYFGRSGTAWALHAAARHLGDDGMAARALELATALPVRWPNCDITHGTAGAGMANLHLWYETKEQTFLDRVDTAVDHLRERASRTDGGLVCWPVPPDFDSKLAGVAHLGFAHGVAGIGAFLLAAAQATGRDDAWRLATQAGDTLAATAVRSAGAAHWPNSVTGPGTSDLRYQWCSGASGVGTFLVRLWRATAQERFRRLAHEAAVTVHRGRWLSGVPVCHGVAGNGEFLLDLAAAGPGPYRGWAEELAACLYLRAAYRQGRLVVLPDQRGVNLNLDFGTGLAGAVGYLLRLVHGGPRGWMVDPAPAG